jgi:hypothetical protein
MKSFLSNTTSLALFAILLYGCNNEEKNITHTAYQYAYYTANYQLDSAANYATDETKNTTMVMGRKLMAAVGEEYIMSDTPAEIEIIDVSQENDTDAYAVYHKTTPIKNFIDTLALKKRNGEWQAHSPTPIVHRINNTPNNPMGIKQLKIDETKTKQTTNY